MKNFTKTKYLFTNEKNINQTYVSNKNLIPFHQKNWLTNNKKNKRIQIDFYFNIENDEQSDLSKLKVGTQVFCQGNISKNKMLGCSINCVSLFKHFNGMNLKCRYN